jgi:hypothetical protein
MATSRASLSAPVWPPDMILVSIIGENYWIFHENSRDLISGLKMKKKRIS